MDDGRVRDRSMFDWVLAVGIVGAAMLIGYVGLEAMRGTQASAPIATVDDPPPTWLPPGTYQFEIPVSQTVQIEKPTAVGVVGIYECVVEGQKVFSDRNCGPGAVQRDIDARGLNTYQAEPIPYVDVRRYHTPGREYAGEPQQGAGSASGSSARKQDRCERIQAQIDRINSRMREGYASREGEYWRARWYEAKNAYSEARCGKPD